MCANHPGQEQSKQQSDCSWNQVTGIVAKIHWKKESIKYVKLLTDLHNCVQKMISGCEH